MAILHQIGIRASSRQVYLLKFYFQIKNKKLKFSKKKKRIKENNPFEVDEDLETNL